MQVSDGMSSVILTVGLSHTLRDAARAMAERKVGAAVVIDPEQPGPGIITERDLLESVGAGQDPDRELVADHLSANLTFAAERLVARARGGGDGAGAASATSSSSRAARRPASSRCGTS